MIFFRAFCCALALAASSAAMAESEVSWGERAINRPSRAEKERAMQTLALAGLDGEKHSLDEWKGKVILLNFWASWCSPCLAEIPRLVGFQEQYRERGLQVVGVGLDEEVKLRNVRRTLEINYPVLLADPASYGGLLPLWGNSSGVIPYAVVLDRAGRVVATHHGLFGREAFDEYVLPLLEMRQ